MPAPATPPTIGRPRDAALDAAILRAAMELLGERGLSALTMDAVAQRAGAGKASVYRRWKSKDELLADALAMYAPVDVEIDTGTLRGDLIALYAHHYGIGNPVTQAAMQEILGNVRQHLAWTAKVAPARLTTRRAKVQEIFARAIARGEIAAPSDLDLVADLVPAMVLYQYNTRAQKVSRARLARLVDGLVLPLVGLPGTAARP
ncbi:TetR/AcrR family transcriptional regulator [Pseudorhodoferax sp.]|uniref:TetR/AcrR family transcriptional regulator n=1 Tax=Pseudorhodoferax sp. TaxID=1993553 RepID=UPI0039E2B3F4